MSIVIQNLSMFMLYAMAAIFVQNAVFTRGFGVSRLTKLVSDSAVDSISFCVLLCSVQVISAPLAYAVNILLEMPQVWYREYARPLAYVICAVVAFLVVLFLIMVLRLPNPKDLMAVLPMATLNCAVLGPMLISATQSFNFVQTMGFALGSGIGYTLAVIIVTEIERKTNSRNIPGTFKGLPIKLIYIGILALAIYSLTGNMVAI